MEPVVAKKGPYAVELDANKEYHWCACGQSKNQPFCDGSHHGTEFVPKAFTPEKAGKYFLCGCKKQLIRHFAMVLIINYKVLRFSM
jgi:CDGSH-type Zn-finger protein